MEDSDVNRFGALLGARGGVTLRAPRLHLGGSFVHFFGEESNGSRYYTNTLDFEVGYDVELGEWFVLRPELGLGLAQAVVIQSDNAGYPLVFHAAPGLLAEGRFHQVVLSVEVREDFMVARGGTNATTVLAGIGYAF